MKNIKLHCKAFAIILPIVLLFSEGSLLVNFIGLIYLLLLFGASNSKSGKQFIRRYYREILRIESIMLT